VLEQLQDKLTGTDALIRAMRGPDRKKFAEVFARSTVLFLQLPPGCENGLDPSLSKEELLGHIRAGAKDLSERGAVYPAAHSARKPSHASAFHAANICAGVRA
jgi:hypothetical protein